MKNFFKKIRFFFWKWWIEGVNVTEASIKKMSIEQLLYLLANKELNVSALGAAEEKIIESRNQEAIDWLLEGNFFFSENAQMRLIARGNHDEIMKLLKKQFCYFKTEYSGKLLSAYVARYNHEEIMFILKYYQFLWGDEAVQKILRRDDPDEIKLLAKAKISPRAICWIIDRGNLEEIEWLCHKQSQTLVDMLFARKKKDELIVLVSVNHHLDKIPNGLKKLFAYGDKYLILQYAVKGGCFDPYYMRELLDNFSLAELDEAMRAQHKNNQTIRYMFGH